MRFQWRLVSRSARVDHGTVIEVLLVESSFVAAICAVNICLAPGRVSGVDLFDRGQVYFGRPGKAVECRTFF